jgi:ABC-type oligopeptide transport system substrate-binding subunit
MMKKSICSVFFVFVMLMVLLSGCAPASTPIPPEPLPTNTIPPENTSQPTNVPDPTSTPEPTALPGQVIYPIDSLQYGIPWLTLDKSKIPLVVYYGFNVNQPPFNIPEVRQAFAAALDTEVLTLIYQDGTFYNDEKPTRTVIPPETLTRDVSGDIGIPYDPELAKQLLAKAGYDDPSSFPETKILIVYMAGSDTPGLLIKAAKEAIRMWEENLGVTVKLEVVGVSDFSGKEQQELIQSGKYQIFEHGVWADNNDPDSFVANMFSPDGYKNFTGYNNAQITKLISDGQKELDPAKRLPIYLEIERILSEQELPIIPIFHGTVDGSNW